MNNSYPDSYVQKYAVISAKWGLWKSERNTILENCTTFESALDIGCGTGRVSGGLLTLGFNDVVGIDNSPAMIRKAIEINQSQGIRYLVLDITEDIPLSYQFDLIFFSYNGFMSVVGFENRIKMLKNIFQMLKNGGVFIFTTHQGVDEQSSDFFDFWESRRRTYYEQGLDVDSEEFYTLDVLDKGLVIPQFFASNEKLAEELTNTGFSVVDSFLRDERYAESEIVIAETNNCRFWICKKNNPNEKS